LKKCVATLDLIRRRHIDLKELLAKAEMTANTYREEKLDADSSLQMLASAYATLFLKTQGGMSTREVAFAHKLIADCLDTLDQPHLAGQMHT
jgi:hypothetical protein